MLWILAMDYPRHITKSVKLGAPLSINCEVPFFSTDCCINMPNGTAYQKKYEFEATLGRCSVEIESAETHHIGEWNCYFARGNGKPDEHILVEVWYYKKIYYIKDTFVLLFNIQGDWIYVSKRLY